MFEGNLIFIAGFMNLDTCFENCIDVWLFLQAKFRLIQFGKKYLFQAAGDIPRQCKFAPYWGHIWIQVQFSFYCIMRIIFVGPLLFYCISDCWKKDFLWWHSFVCVPCTTLFPITPELRLSSHLFSLCVGESVALWCLPPIVIDSQYCKLWCVIDLQLKPPQSADPTGHPILPAVDLHFGIVVV